MICHIRSATYDALRISAFALALVLVAADGTAVAAIWPGAQLEILHTFAGGALDGAIPRAGMIQGTDGNFYGTTIAGGLYNQGTVFRMTSDGTVTLLHSFSGSLTDGADPESELIEALDGNFYGTTLSGGASGLGTIFRVTPSGNFTLLHSFAGSANAGAHPFGELIQTADGWFYGTTSEGGSADLGTVFVMGTTGTVSVLHAFTSDEVGRPRGFGQNEIGTGGGPRAALLQGGDGYFYGTTYGGNVFRIAKYGGFNILHRIEQFGLTNIEAPLIASDDGAFYGTASSSLIPVTAPVPGGMFRIAPDGTYSAIRNGPGITDALRYGPDRRLYFGIAGLFQITIQGGQVTQLLPLASFDTGRNPLSATPLRGGLLQAADRRFYGTVSNSVQGSGTIFRVTLPTPGQPTGLSQTLTSDGVVHLTWTASSGTGTYTIKRRTSSGQQMVIATGVTSTSYDDLLAVDGSTSSYVVTGDNWLTEGLPSNEVSVDVPLRRARVAPGGFDRDGKADLTVYRPATQGHWYVRQSRSGYSYADYLDVPWGIAADIPVPGDYDGDGQTDFAVYRPSNGTWYVLLSSANYGYGQSVSYQWGLPGDVPLVADLDGDRRADLVVYRPSEGTWYVRFSSSGYSYATAKSYPWGLPGDTPLVTDFDGDGKTDLAVYRPSEGTWYLLLSSTNYSYAAWTSYQWGLPGDVPLAADFDGDGKTDLVVYRPSEGTWYLRFSSSNYSFATWTSYQWGLPGDEPVSGDFDGDGKNDLAVWRPSNATWYVRYSGDGFGTWQAYQWGLPGDQLSVGR